MSGCRATPRTSRLSQTTQRIATASTQAQRLMEVLLDTDVLLRDADPAHRMHKDAAEAVRTLRRRGDRLCIAAQNLVEFHSIARGHVMPTDWA